MKRSEKGVLGIILAATLMIGATAVVSANGGTLVDPNSFASKGKIQVKENETDPDPAIVIDSADLVTLANATNELNNQYTNALADAVNNIGSVPKTDRVAAGATFSEILDKIQNSQYIDTSESVYVLPNGTVTGDSTAEGVVETQIAGATADNLTAGTAAWVDGQYIVGTGVDNNSYYDLGVESASPTISLLKADRGTVGSNSDYVHNKYTATDKCIAIAIGYAEGSIPRVNITSNGTAISDAYCFNYSDYNHGAFGSGIYILESGQYVKVTHMDPDGGSGYMIYALKIE